jgi:hypothetical protein
MIGYLIYFNNERHQLDELVQYFSEGLDSDGFYTACMVMGEPMADDDAEEHFNRLCHKYNSNHWLTLDQFLSWMAKRNYTYGMYIEGFQELANSEIDGVELMEGHEELARALEEYAGEYGDLHLEDVAHVLMTATWDQKYEPGAHRRGFGGLSRIPCRSTCRKLPTF